MILKLFRWLFWHRCGNCRKWKPNHQLYVLCRSGYRECREHHECN